MESNDISPQNQPQQNPEPTTPQPTDPLAPPLTPVPGEGLSVAGFIVSLVSLLLNFVTFGVMAIVGLVLSIIGYVKTKRAGRPSGLGLAGIIISIASMVITFAFFIFAAFSGIQLIQKCGELGPGMHNNGGFTITCDNNKLPTGIMMESSFAH